MSTNLDLLENFNAEPFGVLGETVASIKFTCPSMIGEFSINSKREIELGRAQVFNFKMI